MDGFNPNLTLMAERVSHFPGVKSGSDYLFHISKLLLGSQVQYQRRTDTFLTKLGETEFFRADFSMTLPEMTIDQAFFATKRGDYALSIVLSAATEEQMARLEEIASSIRFNAN